MKGHIRKRGDSYQVVVYLGMIGKKKKYKYVTVKRKKEADRILNEILYKINNNTFVDPGRITFGEYLKRWLKDYCIPKLTPRTLKRYEEIVDLHIIPALGDILLAKLQPLDLQEYYSKALISGRIGNKYKKKKGLSPTTVLFHHKVIHKALEMAVKWQLTGRNVADAVEPPRKEKSSFELIENDILLKILKVVNVKCPVLVIPILIAANTGMRRGEVLALMWKDINFKIMRMSIRQQLQRLEGGLKFRPCKSDNSTRSISLSEPLVEMLKKHKAEQNKSRLLAGQAYQDHGLVCCWENGRPIDPDYFTKRFIKIAKVFLPNVRLHDLRHSFATMMLASNVNLKKVSEYLGHGSISITGDIYSHVTPSMGDEIAEIAGVEFLKLDCQGIVKE